MLNSHSQLCLQALQVLRPETHLPALLRCGCNLAGAKSPRHRLGALGGEESSWFLNPKEDLLMKIKTQKQQKFLGSGDASQHQKVFIQNS